MLPVRWSSPITTTTSTCLCFHKMVNFWQPWNPKWNMPNVLTLVLWTMDLSFWPPKTIGCISIDTYRCHLSVCEENLWRYRAWQAQRIKPRPPVLKIVSPRYWNQLKTAQKRKQTNYKQTNTNILITLKAFDRLTTTPIQPLSPSYILLQFICLSL